MLETNTVNSLIAFLGTPVIGESGVIYGTAAYGGISPCYTAAPPPILISSYGCGTVYSYTL